MSLAIAAAERGLLPDSATRYGIRRLLQRRRDALSGSDDDFVAALRKAPIAVDQQAANDQHYTVPAAFYRLALGPNLKYSSCLWDDTTSDLGAAEDAMLDLYCQRAQLADGQRILDVGCGWGSLSLYLAKRYPASAITAISNSASQRAFIEHCAEQCGLSNLQVITADLATFSTEERFDRLMSIECLEHMRNHGPLFARFRTWLTADGLAFIHVFCHRDHSYLFEDDGDGDWMARHFFTGGMMPSFDLFRHYQDDLKLINRWAVNGHHYARTARAWLTNIDHHQSSIEQLFAADLGSSGGRRMFQRWRLFFMACEECFVWDDGSEWFVGHYLLRPQC
ncbi:MAG: SAM-dependent methyltransferase [Planctomycetota bacterium]|jgi:cyclopropane-fatty-acyl-phospholipid synthase